MNKTYLIVIPLFISLGIRAESDQIVIHTDLKPIMNLEERMQKVEQSTKNGRGKIHKTQQIMDQVDKLTSKTTDIKEDIVQISQTIADTKLLHKALSSIDQLFNEISMVKDNLNQINTSVTQSAQRQDVTTAFEKLITEANAIKSLYKTVAMQLEDRIQKIEQSAENDRDKIQKSQQLLKAETTDIKENIMQISQTITDNKSVQKALSTLDQLFSEIGTVKNNLNQINASVTQSAQRQDVTTAFEKLITEANAIKSLYKTVAMQLENRMQKIEQSAENDRDKIQKSQQILKAQATDIRENIVQISQAIADTKPLHKALSSIDQLLSEISTVKNNLNQINASVTQSAQRQDVAVAFEKLIAETGAIRSLCKTIHDTNRVQETIAKMDEISHEIKRIKENSTRTETSMGEVCQLKDYIMRLESKIDSLEKTNKLNMSDMVKLFASRMSQMEQMHNVAYTQKTLEQTRHILSTLQSNMQALTNTVASPLLPSESIIGKE